MSLGLLFFITGCDKEENQDIVLDNNTLENQYTPESIDEVITQDNFRKFIKSKPKVVIEYTTPEEMNTILVKNGLDPIPQSEVDEYYERKRQGTLRQFPSGCHTANLIAELGDVSGNGSLSTWDVVLAQWIVNAWTDGQNMCVVQNAMILEDYKVGKMSSFSAWGRANTNDVYGLAFNHYEDPEVIRKVLLGISCCD